MYREYANVMQINDEDELPIYAVTMKEDFVTDDQERWNRWYLDLNNSYSSIFVLHGRRDFLLIHWTPEEGKSILEGHCLANVLKCPNFKKL
jgi:hypothetical protein